MHHRLVALALALPLAVDGEERRAEQGLPLRLGDARPDDDVDRAGLVLERDEDRSLGRLGPLPVRHQAAGARQPAVREGAQARRRLDAEGGELRPQQRQRMALQRQAEGAVVGVRLFALARRGQGDAGFVAARRAQHLGRPGVDAGDRPRRLVAMAGERLQGARFGEHRQGMGIEPGAPRQVFDAGEGRLGARGDDALAGFFGEALDATEAEAHRLRAPPGRAASRRARPRPPSCSPIRSPRRRPAAPRRRARARRAPAAPARRSPSAGR